MHFLQDMLVMKVKVREPFGSVRKAVPTSIDVIEVLVDRPTFNIINIPIYTICFKVRSNPKGRTIDQNAFHLQTSIISIHLPLTLTTIYIRIHFFKYLVWTKLI